MNKRSPLVRNYFSLLPFMTSTVKSCLMLASYLVAIIYNKNISYLPHPSDLGITYPERGLFGLALTLGSTLTFAVVLLRYVHINSIYPRNVRGLNKFSISCGILMSFADLVVAVYPNIDEVRMEHLIGTCVYFLSGIIYMITQTHISRKLSMLHANYVIYVRLACCVLAACGSVAYGVGRILAPENKDWYYKIPHGAEWIVELCIIVYIFTFCSDFNTVRFRSYILDGGSLKNGNMRSTNYIDYLRSQGRTRRISDGHIKYHVNTKC